MVDAAPFRALRYDPAVAGDVRTTSAPALDELDPFDYARHRTASPYTVLELLGPRTVDGNAALARWRRTGVLALDDRPAFYAYEQRTSSGHVQRGVLAAVRVERGAAQAILPHEDVDPARVAARLERLLTVGVDIAPVFTVTGELSPAVRGLLDDALAAPLVEVADEAGTVHRLGRCEGSERITAVRDALAGVTVLIADGHHRYAAAVAAAAVGAGDRTLMLIVDAARSAPRVLPVHRLLPDPPADWRTRLAPLFSAPRPAPAGAAALTAALAAEPEGTVALRVPGTGLLLAPADLDRLRAARLRGHSPLWRTLDTALVDTVLLPLLGVGPAEVRYRADLDAVAEVDRRGGALVVVRPVPLTTVEALAARGERLPAKTTSFRPKPRTGLVLRLR